MTNTATPQTAPPPLDRDEWLIVIVSSLGHFFSHLYMLLFPALVLPLQRDLGLPMEEIIPLAFLGSLLFGVGALPVGYLTDRVGARPMLVTCLVGSGGAACLVGLSSGPWGLWLGLGLMGLCASIYHPAGLSLISKSVRARGRAMGLNGIAGNAGHAVAPFAAGLMAYLAGWRGAYLVLGGIGMLAGFVSAWLPIKETVVESREHRLDSSKGRRALYFGLLCVAMALAGLSYWTTSLIFPATFEQRIPAMEGWLSFLGIDTSSGMTVGAGALVSLIYVVGIWGQLAGGRAADRHDLRLSYMVFHLASIPFLLLLSGMNSLWLVGLGSGYMFFSLGMQPIENSLVAKLSPPGWRSTAYGLKFAMTFGVGSAAAYVVPWVKVHYGLPAAFLAAALCVTGLLAAAGLLYGLSRRAVPRMANLMANR